MPDTPVLRFAPSPNGFLHLGHAYSALLTDKWAKDMGGKWLLRIEDTDPERSRPQFVTAIYQDLKWLGLSWPEPVLVQSSRFDIYKAAAEKLRDMGLLYPCFCSRKDIRANAVNQAGQANQTDPDGAPLYPGTCKALSQDEIQQNISEGMPVQYRLDMDKAFAKTGPLTFTRIGPSPMDRPQITYAQPMRWGDVVIQRKDTPTSYHLAVVVDDAFQNITHVTRGRDMQAGTDIHIMLQFLLGLPAPLYTFHKLILDDEGKKLAKSSQSTCLNTLRKAGATPKDIRARLGF